jgi:Tfp pilus assembly protein PilV
MGLMSFIRDCIRRKKTRPARWLRGLSIIEVTLALSLLLVAMVPILKNLTRAHQMSAEMEKKTLCLVLARGKLDDIRARSIYTFGSSGFFTASNVDLGNSYLCNVTDTIVDTDLKKITVSVGYDADGGGTLSSGEVAATLATYVARRW